MTPGASSGSLPVPADDDLASLVVRAVGGDGAAQDALIVTIRPKVVRYCRRRLQRIAGSDHSADDVAQEVCMAVLSALPSYRDVGRPFMAFVHGIAAHKVADAKRAAMRGEAPLATIPDGVEHTAGPEERAITADDAHAARRLLDRLPPDQWDLLLLRVVRGLSAEETGKALGMSAGAVRVSQHRALTRLRGLVTEAGIQ